MELKGDIVKINEISQSEIEEMYILMTEFYNDVDKDVFLKDLKEKDYCIILKDDKNKVKGFSNSKDNELYFRKWRNIWSIFRWHNNR